MSAGDLSPEILARRARVSVFVLAPVFGALGLGLTGFGLAAPPMLVAGIAEMILSVLLVDVAFVDAPIARGAASVVALLGITAAAVLAVTTLPGALGLAVTYVIGVASVLGLTWFIVRNVGRAAHAER